MSKSSHRQSLASRGPKVSDFGSNDPRDRDGSKFRLSWICGVAAMGGFLFGYDWVVIGGAASFYESYFEISESPLLKGWAMSSALMGCLLGAVISAIGSDRVGRKPLLLVAGILFVTSAIGTACSETFAVFNVSRILGGVGIGLASHLSPMYIAEISPAESRGRLVSINQLAIVLGILSAQIINWIIAEPEPGSMLGQTTWNATLGWRWMFAAEIVPAALFLIGMLTVPPSPRWLVKIGQREHAVQTLGAIVGRESAEKQVADIADAMDLQQLETTDSPPHLFWRGNGKVLTLGVFLAVFQQWCGINVIFNYAQEIFSAAGYGVGDTMFNIVITGIVNLLFTIVAMTTVDRWGRRGLMLVGSAGLAIIYAALGGCFYVEIQGGITLVLVVSAIACYAMSLAPVVWVVISEIFPTAIRGRAMGLSVFSLWLACAALTFTFPLLNDAMGPHGTFWLYGAICALGFVVLWRSLPETKHQTLEQIESRWKA